MGYAKTKKDVLAIVNRVIESLLQSVMDGGKVLRNNAPNSLYEL